MTLDPEELGRIRLTLKGREGCMIVTVHADRAETLDLLRRNIDMLAQDFRDLGYVQTSFSFGGGSEPSSPSFSLPPQGAPAPKATVAAGFDQPTLTARSEGLDLRL